MDYCRSFERNVALIATISRRESEPTCSLIVVAFEVRAAGTVENDANAEPGSSSAKRCDGFGRRVLANPPVTPLPMVKRTHYLYVVPPERSWSMRSYPSWD